MGRFLRLLFVAVLFGAAGLFNAGPASATALPLSSCSTSTGVILAVDFTPFGGGIYRACGSTPTSGWTLLHQGGWSTAGTQHDGPAFVCRIGYSGFSGGTQFPTASQEACVLTPPANHYWSYWHADAGQNTWSYSKSGAQGTSPGPGSVDAWVYGATDVNGSGGGPSFSPAQVRATNPAPPSSGGGTGGGGTGGGGTGSGSTGGSGISGSKAPIVGPAPSKPAASHGPTPTSSAAAKARASTSAAAKSSAALRSLNGSAAPTSSSSAPKVIDAQPAADVHHSTGSIMPMLLGGLIIAVIAGFIGVQWFVRKQADQQL